MTPLLKAVVSWWIHCCVFLFALVIMQDFPTLWALGCSLSADSCARALGPSDKLVGYWSNSSSSSDIAIPFFSFTVLFLQCYLLFFVLLCDLLLRCCTRILSGILTWVPSSLYVIVWSSSCYLLLLSSFLCFLCDLLLRCCTRIPCTVWYPDLGPFFGCPLVLKSTCFLFCVLIFLGLLIFRLLHSYYWVFGTCRPWCVGILFGMTVFFFCVRDLLTWCHCFNFCYHTMLPINRVSAKSGEAVVVLDTLDSAHYPTVLLCFGFNPPVSLCRG